MRARKLILRNFRFAAVWNPEIASWQARKPEKTARNQWQPGATTVSGEQQSLAGQKMHQQVWKCETFAQVCRAI